MKATQYNVTHYYQPTANTCGYAALAILLSHYGSDLGTETIVEQVPQPLSEDGKPVGSISAQLATWCREQGYKVHFYSFDCQILDHNWAGLDSEALIKKLEAIKDIRDVAGIGGKYWTKIYIQAYIDFLQAGGELEVRPYVTLDLLYELLKQGPVYVNLCSAVMNNSGHRRSPDPAKRESVADDIHGRVGNHSVVIYGNDENGDFLIADPWDGVRVIKAEVMVPAITTAQIECDNQCFVVSK